MNNVLDLLKYFLQSIFTSKHDVYPVIKKPQTNKHGKVRIG